MDQPAAAPNTQSKPTQLPSCKPKVIGIYGVQGCGKSYLLKRVSNLEALGFSFFDGSTIISDSMPGGLKEFENMASDEKSRHRAFAIEKIQKLCASSQKIGVVAGHLMLWDEGTGKPIRIDTPSDWEVYTHILYIKVDSTIVAERRKGDNKRNRCNISPENLSKWIEEESSTLYNICISRGILFSILSRPQEQLMNYLLAIQDDQEECNLTRLEARLDSAIKETNHLKASISKDQGSKAAQEGDKYPKTVLLFDADRTISPADTGKIFFSHLSCESGSSSNDKLRILFEKAGGYSYAAFRQVSSMYQEIPNNQFQATIEKVVSKVQDTIFPDIIAFFKDPIISHTCRTGELGIVILTCGLERIWSSILKKNMIKIPVIGSGRLDETQIVTPDIKAALVRRIKMNGARVWAFGDSPIDIPMLKEAHHAVVVAGPIQSRSTNMPSMLSQAIKEKGEEWDLFQMLPSDDQTPLLAKFPLRTITLQSLLDEIKMKINGYQFQENHELEPIKSPSLDCVTYPSMQHVNSSTSADVSVQIHHLTNNSAAHLLSTEIRDASISGPKLYRAHFRVGRYLALTFLGSVLGLDEHPIDHVQGHSVMGYHVRNEQRTGILALMRAGLPLAEGVWEVLPHATFVHVKEPSDIKTEHLERMQTIVLCDTVVNSGKTVNKFIDRLVKMNALSRTSCMKVVIVAGVVQKGAVDHGGVIRNLMQQYGINLVALRLSENKYKGTCKTDTGNRIFNTTYEE